MHCEFVNLTVFHNSQVVNSNPALSCFKTQVVTVLISATFCVHICLLEFRKKLI